MTALRLDSALRDAWARNAWVLSGLCLLVAAGCTAPPSSVPLVVAEEARYQFGDDKRWAAPDWNDDAWPARPVAALPDSAGVLWLRMRLDAPRTKTLGLVVAAAAARDVYWDGVLIGSAGRVGASPEEEEPGPIDVLVRVPDSLAAPGSHIVALRLSSFHRPAAANGLLLHVVAGEYRTLVEGTQLLIVLPLVFLGAFVLVALYHGLLFAADRQWVSLLTAALCLALAALLVAEGWRLAVGYAYDWHVVRLRIVDVLSWASGSLLVATLAAQFAVPRRRALVTGAAGVLAVLLLAIGPHEVGTFAVFAVAIACSLGIAGWAVVQHKPGARLVLGGVGVCFVALLYARLDFMESALFPAFGVLIAGLLTNLGLQARRQRERHVVALATAARLEAELLKKHLQPHFLLNALTSILEWVETDPPQGARALEALSAELRTLSDVSGERLIPMARELALCRTHLDVMGYRKGNTFELDASGVDGAALIPPAVIHTLVENAITHNAYAPGLVRFTLREERTATHRTLTFSAPLATSSPEIRPERGGLRYIRARLDECTPGRWSLSAGPEAGAWATRLRLPLDLRPLDLRPLDPTEARPH